MTEQQAELPGTEPTARERFDAALRADYPGGDLLAAHVDEGPWYGVLLPMSATGPDLAYLAVGVWPGRPVIRYTGNSWPSLVHVHVVPKLVHDLLVFFGSIEHPDWSLSLYESQKFGPYDTEPTDADLICDLRAVIAADLDSDALTDLSQRFDLAGLTAVLVPLIGNLARESRINVDQEFPRVVAAVRDSTA
jgi:hypothetical protein